MEGAKIDAKNGRLVLDLPMEKEPAPSNSGKTLLVSSSRGTITTGVMVNGKPLKVTWNAFIAADKEDDKEKPKKSK